MRFNTYLALLFLALVGGCQTGDGWKKEASTLRLHLEVSQSRTDHEVAVPVYRENPVMINIEKAPFLDESYMAEAKIVDQPGGFAIQIQFDRSGTLLLEEYSTAHKGGRFAIFSQFGNTAPQARWLAAPLISQRITNGVLVFTPDATREESERIVLGLNNVAKLVKKHTR